MRRTLDALGMEDEGFGRPGGQEQAATSLYIPGRVGMQRQYKCM
jgi:hypothetical protein